MLLPPYVVVRLKEKEFAELLEEEPLLKKNEFDLIDCRAGRWCWIVTLRYRDPDINFRYGCEDFDLDDSCQSVILSLFGQHYEKARTMVARAITSGLLWKLERQAKPKKN